MIRKAESADDFLAIENLAREIIPEFYAGIIPHDHNLFFIEKYQTVSAITAQLKQGYEYYLIEEKLLPVGYFGYRFVPGESKMLLSKLYLLRNFRGQGMGTAAMDFIIQKAVSLQLNQLTLTVHRENRRTIGFYERYGFQISRNLTNEFENGHTILDYEMTRSMRPEMPF